MKDISLALIAGVDIPVEECHLVLHQPKLREIALIGEKDFLNAVQCLNINKSLCGDKDESLLQNTTNFQIFMTAMLDKRVQEKKANVEQVLSLLLPNYKVTFIPQSLILMKEGQQPVSIDNSNFDTFQDIIASIFCIKPGMGDSFNPGTEKANEIAKKLMKARQRVAQEKGESEISSFSTYISSLAIAQQQTITEISEYTIYQLYDALERYQLWLTWDIDMKSRLAGGKPDNKPENWMKNIH